jgi:hypothetical protein
MSWGVYCNGVTIASGIDSLNAAIVGAGYFSRDSPNDLYEVTEYTKEEGFVPYCLIRQGNIEEEF